MTLLVPDVGELNLLNRALGKVTPTNLTLALFTSNTTPADGDTLATYTKMTLTFGYTDLTLTMANWTVTTIANVASATYAQQTWTFTGAAGNQYGYVIHDGTSLVYAERFSAGPYNFLNNGDIIRVTPVITLSKV